MLRFCLRVAVESIVKYRIEFEYAPFPLDKLWIEVSLTDRGAIEESGERFGYGAVYSSRDAREYKFSLYESSEAIAGLDWCESEYEAGELHILKRRLAVDDSISSKMLVRATTIKSRKFSNSLNPLRWVFAFLCIRLALRSDVLIIYWQLAWNF